MNSGLYEQRARSPRTYLARLQIGWPVPWLPGSFLSLKERLDRVIVNILQH